MMELEMQLSCYDNDKHFLPVSLTFVETTRSNGDFHREGIRISDINNQSGESILEKLERDNTLDGLFMTKKVESKRFGSGYETDTTIQLTIEKDEILPIVIEWIEQDSYTASGFGNSGTVNRLKSRVSSLGIGQILIETKRRWEEF